MIDYKELVDNLREDDVKQLLTNLDIPFKETLDYLLMPTACHNVDLDEASWKLYYYKDTHFFYCYTNCGGMSIFKFLEEYYKTRDYEYDWYNDIYKVVENCSNARNITGFTSKKRELLKDKFLVREIPDLPIYPAGVLDVFTRYYPVEWLNDGITKDSMDDFNILFSVGRNKIIIPHYSINGDLVGIRGRALDPWEVENVGKYAPVRIEDTIYRHPLGLNLYGLNKTKENIKENGVCFLFEAEKSVLQSNAFDRPNCSAAVCGSNINIYQIKLLIQNCHPQEIVVCFDKEELPHSDKYFNKLYKTCEKYKNYCNFSFIYDRRNLLNLKDSPTDKGEDIFNQLLKERVRVK